MAGEEESVVFAQLKSCCLELLEFLQNPAKQCPALSRLLDLLRTSSPDSLQHLFDYILFPLLLLLDASIKCRSCSQKDVPKLKFLIPDPLKPPSHIGDAVAELLIQCLEELFKKCHLGSVEQMTVVLKKLTYGVMLSPSEASEEFREGVIKCFRALISKLHQCSDASCSCSQSLHRPILEDREDLECARTLVKESDSRSEACLLSFLQSVRASAAVGHWLSLLLNAADAEAVRGHRGSAKLRVEAFFTLRVLVAKIGCADSLAFFLPGVVSQLIKVLHKSKSMLSGAAGSTEAIEHAVRCLAEFLVLVLQDSNYHASHGPSNGSNMDSNGSPQFILEELHHLYNKTHNHNQSQQEDSNTHEDAAIKSMASYEEKITSVSGDKASFHVDRTQDWMKKTSAHVTRLLSSTFPHLSLHPSRRVRRGLLASVRLLLQKCMYTLNESRFMLLECLCHLVCDDSEEVSLAAQEFLEYLFVSGIRNMESDVAEIFSRLLEKLPKAVLGGKGSSAIAHTHQLLGVMYYSGPQLVVNHLLVSPIKAARALDVFASCLSPESVFAGSLGKLLQSRPPSSTYLHSIIELKSSEKMTSDEQASLSFPENLNPNIEVKQAQFNYVSNTDYTLPRTPPWFIHAGREKLYRALAHSLRLICLSSISDRGSKISFPSLVDIPLCHLRKLVSDIRMKRCTRESWQSWYANSATGPLLRQASTAVCMLNEMLFGLSNQALDDFSKMFHKKNGKVTESRWAVWQDTALQHPFNDYVRVIFHEYINPDIWDLPVEPKSPLSPTYGDEAVNFNIFQDVAVLQQVIVDGIGILSLCLGKEFVSSGFLHSALYLLLENLISSNFGVRHASDVVLRIISSVSGYSTVGHMVVANSDYIIDSICSQLRHLDLNPRIPDVLASMLSYIGMANTLLPLLEEPMRSISVELEILSRHRHPGLTISFLKAVAEIAKGAKHEAGLLPDQAESLMLEVNAKLLDLKEKLGKEREFNDHDQDDTAYNGVNISSAEPEEEAGYCEVDVEEWETILLNLNDRKRYRRIVGSLASSCLVAVTPLLASVNEAECLVALDIVEHGMATLSKVEKAYKSEKATREAILQVASMGSLYHLEDTLNSDEGTEENILLPAANKNWPFLIACIKNRNPLSVKRCMAVVTSVVQLCGGDFFARRFHNDGPHFWKLLTTSPFQKKPFLPNEERNKLLLPYRSTSLTLENPVSEITSLKVQISLLNMIADISRNKRSCSALEVVLKKVSGLIVGIACSGVSGLRDASINALLGLASIDPDLIWLLVADVYYSMKPKTIDLPAPAAPEFPELGKILPPPISFKDYLYVRYAGQTCGFNIDFSSVEEVFRKLNAKCSDL